MRAGSAPICRPAFPKSSEICNTCVSGSVSPPQVTIMPSGSNVILTWPTNATGFTLQSTILFRQSSGPRFLRLRLSSTNRTRSSIPSPSRSNFTVWRSNGPRALD